LNKWLIFTVQKKDVIIERKKKSVAWGQCTGVVGGRRALLVGHREKGGGGREWGQGRGNSIEHYKLNNIILGGGGAVEYQGGWGAWGSTRWRWESSIGVKNTYNRWGNGRRPRSR
jgi:hypothetical protein